MDDLRSYLRKREAWFRKQPLHDAHVRAFLKAYPPTRRGLWTCPKCGKQMRRVDVPRNADGKLKRHCGCRTGAHWRNGYIKYQAIGNSKSAEFKRAARIMGLPGFKQVKHDAHVKARKLMLLDASWMLALINSKRPYTENHFAKEKLSEDELLNRRRERDNKNTELLKDKYVRHLIVKSLPLLKGVELPQSLIDLERARLIIVREIASRRNAHE